VAKLCRSVWRDALLDLRGLAAAWTARQNRRADSGSTALQPSAQRALGVKTRSAKATAPNARPMSKRTVASAALNDQVSTQPISGNTAVLSELYCFDSRWRRTSSSRCSRSAARSAKAPATELPPQPSIRLRPRAHFPCRARKIRLIAVALRISRPLRQLCRAFERHPPGDAVATGDTGSLAHGRPIVNR
jgi:hypothetical protein